MISIRDHAGTTLTILGTDGEDAIRKGLKLLFNQGTPDERKQATSVLQHIDPNFQSRSFDDWAKAENELGRPLDT